MRTLPDIPFAEALVDGGRRKTTLCYDAYLPDGDNTRRPAVILAFGGAFHRGTKEDDAFPGAGDTGTNTAIAEYCRRFAADGIACFSIRYRLAPEFPVPGDTPVLTRPEAVPTGRIDEVRRLMGLKPASALDIAQVMEAAIDDMVAAAQAIRNRAEEHGIDPDRVILGGWSAGARCAMYAAFAARVPCVGVLALSGAMQPEDAQAHIAPGVAQPPLLLITAERDLPYMLAAPAQAAMLAFQAKGVSTRHLTVTGWDHWYPAEAQTDGGVTVQQAMRMAIQDWTGA